jgi:thiol-disulfide isomerase/thioredoxin
MPVAAALAVGLPLVLLAASCASREAGAERKGEAQATPAAAPAPDAPPETTVAAPAPPMQQAAAPKTEPTSPPAAPAPAEAQKEPQVPLPTLPPAQERVAAPALTVADMEGREITIAGLAGRPVMVVFWATWCRPCIMEIPHLVHLQETYGKRGLTILAISLDANGLAAVKPFLEKHPEVNYTVVPNGMQAQAAFGGIRSIPTAFLLDRKGRVARKFVGLTPGEELAGWVQAALRERG